VFGVSTIVNVLANIIWNKMINVRPLCKALAIKASRELNEVPARVPEDIETLREWLLTQKHLRTPLDDQFLITFLRGCKYSIQKAKEKIDLFFTVREEIPELVRNRDPLDKRIGALLKLGCSLAIPNPPGDGGPQIQFIRPGLYNTSEYTVAELFKINSILTDVMISEDDNFIISGAIGIMDFTNVTKEHFNELDAICLKKIAKLNQEAQPATYLAFHYIHISSQFEEIFNMFKGFMSEENRRRLYVHQNIETLYDYVPRKLLPTEYGGDAGPIQNMIDIFETKVISCREKLLRWEHYGVDESLRVDKSRSLIEIEKRNIYKI